MKLINVRKGQFVYYNNELHKVYSIKPFFKQSVHLIRLKDLEQEIVTAKEITYYRPKHLDSFTVSNKRYTLDKNAHAKIGDYILVINPQPDSMDHHHLHAIELVSSLEEHGVISNKANGIKHNEYWVMVQGFEEGATNIDQPDHLDPNDVVPKVEGYEFSEFIQDAIVSPKIGDVYQKNDSEPVIQAMVIAIKGRTVYLGGNLEVPVDEIIDTNKWSYVLHVMDQ